MKKITLLFLLILSACMEDNLTPEAALKSMVESRMGKVVTREEALEKVTGKMKESLENMSEEDFAKYKNVVGFGRDFNSSFLKDILQPRMH